MAHENGQAQTLQTADRAASDVPSGDELVARVRALAPLLEEEAAGNERAGRVSDGAVEALREAELLDCLAPAEYGGADLGPVDALRVLEELSIVDGSTAWIAAAATITGKMLHFLQPDVVRELHAERVPFLAGQVAPLGKAVAVEGGYRITGHWQYGSGLLNADWACSAALVMKDGKPDVDADGVPHWIGFMVPADRVELAGNWDVFGLEATGSVDYLLEDELVPHEHVMERFNRAEMVWGGRTALIGLTGWFLIAHTGWGLGIGRRVLDELAAYARKPAKGPLPRLADSEPFKLAFADAEARFRSAHAWVYEIWREIEATIDAGTPPSTRQLTLARAAAIHLKEVDMQVATFAFREAGGAALRAGTLQRLFRNALAGGQHIITSPKKYIPCAVDLLGEAEGMSWRLHDLVAA